MAMRWVEKKIRKRGNMMRDVKEEMK